MVLAVKALNSSAVPLNRSTSTLRERSAGLRDGAARLSLQRSALPGMASTRNSAMVSLVTYAANESGTCMETVTMSVFSMVRSVGAPGTIVALGTKAPGSTPRLAITPSKGALMMAFSASATLFCAGSSSTSFSPALTLSPMVFSRNFTVPAICGSRAAL